MVPYPKFKSRKLSFTSTCSSDLEINAPETVRLPVTDELPVMVAPPAVTVSPASAVIGGANDIVSVPSTPNLFRALSESKPKPFKIVMSYSPKE